MYKIRHKETGLFFSTGGARHYPLLGYNRKYYNDRSFLSKYGKTWSTEKGPQKIFKYLNSVYPDTFEIVKFVEYEPTYDHKNLLRQEI